MYDNGQGVAMDEAEGARLYRQAAERGEAASLYETGLRYRDGRGVPKDEAEAALWLRKALASPNADENTRKLARESLDALSK
jgi:TPR repeat protein